MIDLNMEPVFKEIESTEFCCQANLASGIKMFREIIEKSFPYGTLLRMLIALQTAPDETLRRIEKLKAVEYNHEYQHPHDTALATYVLALSSAERDAGVAGAQMIMDMNDLFWARQVAVKVLGL